MDNARKYTCSACGKVYAELNAEYVFKNPNASDMHLEDLLLKHQAYECETDWDHVVTCECGDEIFRCDIEYFHKWPNSCDIAVEQAIEDHAQCCPMLWEEWHKNSGCPENITPHNFLKEEYKRGKRLALYKLPVPPDRYEGDWEYEIKELIKNNREEENDTFN